MIKYNSLISLKSLTTSLTQLKRSWAPKIKTKKTQEKLLDLHFILKKQIGSRTLNPLNSRIIEQALTHQLSTMVNQLAFNYNSFIIIKKPYHETLNNIKQNWGEIDWVLRIKPQQIFEPQSQIILFRQLTGFCDEKTLNLLYQLLKKQKNEVFSSNSKLSSLATEVYFHLFDNLITGKKIKKSNNKYVKTFNALTKKQEEDKKNWSKNKLWFIRHKQDILIGLKTSRIKAHAIKYLLEQLLTNKLKLKINKKESYLNAAIKTDNFFLGYFLKKNYSKVIYVSNQKFQLKAPINMLVRLFCRWGYAKIKNTNLLKATAVRKIVTKTDSFIFHYFEKKIKQFSNFYTLAYNRQKVKLFIRLYKTSCLLTLAKKHRLKNFKTAYLKYKEKHLSPLIT